MYLFETLYYQVEKLILAHSRWSLCFPTALAYVEAIGPAALDGIDIAKEGATGTVQKRRPHWREKGPSNTK